jgi:hypothetical protein
MLYLEYEVLQWIVHLIHTFCMLKESASLCFSRGMQHESKENVVVLGDHLFVEHSDWNQTKGIQIRLSEFYQEEWVNFVLFIGKLLEMYLITKTFLHIDRTKAVLYVVSFVTVIILPSHFTRWCSEFISPLSFFMLDWSRFSLLINKVQRFWSSSVTFFNDESSTNDSFEVVLHRWEMDKLWKEVINGPTDWETLKNVWSSLIRSITKRSYFQNHIFNEEQLE